jgi:hypothetical protein
MYVVQVSTSSLLPMNSAHHRCPSARWHGPPPWPISLNGTVLTVETSKRSLPSCRPTSPADHRSSDGWPSAATASSSRAAKLLSWSFRYWHDDRCSCPGFLDVDVIVIAFLDRPFAEQPCEASRNQWYEKTFTMTSNYLGMAISFVARLRLG